MKGERGKMKGELCETGYLTLPNVSTWFVHGRSAQGSPEVIVPTLCVATPDYRSSGGTRR